MGKRVKGSNAHGFSNESLIVQALNEKKIKELNLNLKKFVKDICKENEILNSDETVVQAWIETNNKLKQDFYIVINGQEFGISLKMGTGNSVHQEKIEDFIQWFSKSLADELTNEIKDSLRFFIWADGSIDGQAPIVKNEEGKIIGRFGGKEFKKLFPEKQILLQEFMDKNASIILNRAIFEGKNNSKVDYVYHGNPMNGVWISKEEILAFNMKNPKSKATKNIPTLSVGRLTVQAWNVSLKGNTEEKRGEIQFKYSTMVDDFENLMILKASNVGSYEGEREEFNISKIMNKNKKHKFWNIIADVCNIGVNKENYYIIKVEGNKVSKLSWKKVKCKSDAFIIKANIDKDYLLQCEYQITENALEDIEEYEVIQNSGISVKRADSQKYTIVKLTINTFKKAFEKYIQDIDLIIVALLLYSEKNKVLLNRKILEDLKLDENDVILYYTKKYGIIGNSVLDTVYISEISKKAKVIVKETIESNTELKASLFTGKGWFDDPYSIDFIFKNGELTSEVYTDYNISNGSGRSTGKYTIILKPN